MFIHANTVRYRLKRVGDITGYNPLNPATLSHFVSH
jgi:sugar diacid utilization regulator